VAFQYETQPLKELKNSKIEEYPPFWEGKGKGIQQIAKFLT